MLKFLKAGKTCFRLNIQEKKLLCCMVFNNLGWFTGKYNKWLSPTFLQQSFIDPWLKRMQNKLYSEKQ